MATSTLTGIGAFDVVTVSYAGKIVCQKEFHTSWETSPSGAEPVPNVRWIFDASIPADATGALITWETKEGYVAEPLGSSMGTEPAQDEERLPRIICTGNNHIQGKYKYSITLNFPDRQEVLDPEGKNDPTLP